MSLPMKIICINDANKPKEIPAEKWIKLHQVYTLVGVQNLLSSNSFGFELDEIKLDETGKSYPAKITRVNGKIDPVSQTIKVAAVIDGEFKDIAPGMSGVLVISPPESDNK